MQEQPSLDLADDNIKHIALGDLLLDPDNPRFGSSKGSTCDQAEILDNIVSTFSIEDVLSSIAFNGYFPSEPLICYEAEDGKYIVAEGNRRLAACLILKGDVRAKNQKRRTETMRKVWAKHGSKGFDPVPVITFKKGAQDKELLSYLGVRHIAGSHKWDSYAKAAWVASVVESGAVSLNDVVAMIGDSTKTAERLLEGYYLVSQLENEGAFNPANSIRKGRGSAASYPFSWVYTLLGYKSVRTFLGLSDDAPHPDPLEKSKIPDAAMLLDAMFGNKATGSIGNLGDSREISALARVVAEPHTVEQLRAGKNVKTISAELLPLEKRLFAGLNNARAALREIAGLLSEEDVAHDVAMNLQEQLVHIRRSAKDINDKLKAYTERLDDDL